MDLSVNWNRRLSLLEEWQEKMTKSYVANLFAKGINKMAQKVGEEAVEVVIEAKDNDDHLFLNESTEFVVSLFNVASSQRLYTSKDVVDVLKQRHK